MRRIFVLFFLFIGLCSSAQNTDAAFKPGEWLKFRLHYGWLNASYATLQVNSNYVEGVPVYHVVGRGETTGFASVFFKVDDTYESYFGKEDGKPYRFVRKIDEGGYKKDYDIVFDHQNDTAVLNDKKNKKKINFTLQDSIQDLLSAFYYLRNNYNPEDLVKGENIKLKMLYDDDGIFNFKLKYLGNEVLKTKYGKVECYKFRPLVQSGRVFKEKESLSLWVSADKNRIPIRIKADLAVGAIKADLDGYNGLKHQFKIIMD
ncbi:DUF3108 domain-containing protein [uncultured Kriegella sp.]|uniref:DUF3108 domain-containing protein n=1 Tax=uncultured Kriegella sp. TaxID=1798910 RepID=UPI0030DDA4CA|tara:strand:+ start:268379 stop:269158 length:780 start_codon:yes stop_codon:yes gene_type:complete